MSELFQKILDLILPKISYVTEIFFNLWTSPITTLSERIEEGNKIGPSLLFFFIMSTLTYSIMLMGLLVGKVELDPYRLGFGFIMSQFLILIFYSIAAFAALKIVHVQSTLRKVLMSTAYLYGQVTVAGALTCIVIIYAAFYGGRDLLSGILLSLGAGFFLSCFGWYLMCKVLGATRIKIIISFILVCLFIVPLGSALGVIVRPLVHF